MIHSGSRVQFFDANKVETDSVGNPGLTGIVAATTTRVTSQFTTHNSIQLLHSWLLYDYLLVAHLALGLR